MLNIDAGILNQAFASFLEEWGTLLNVGLGVTTLIGLLAFGYSLTLLIVKSDDPRGRQDAISRLWKTGLTTALTGGFWAVVGMMYVIFLG